MKKIISIVLSLILLFTSIGMAKSTHFCGGLEMLSELSLNASHINCGMEQKKPDCDTNDGKVHVHQDSGCCDNEFEVLQLDEDFSINKASFHLNLDFAFALVHTFIFKVSLEETTATTYSDYSPPFLKQDHQVLFQTFII
ncbi:HYC_CC_PP family protein [Algoriphagus lutimaris]